MSGTAPNAAPRGYSGLAVFAHGYHLGAPDWETVCWGRAPDQLGRAPAALLAALDMDADHLVFGMGGAKSGTLYHVDRLYTVLIGRFEELGQFSAFDGRLAAARDILANRLLLAPDANGSTRGELEGLIPVLAAVRCKRLALVSSPDHLPRCLRDAHTVLADRPVRISGVMADTSMGGAPPVVIEQPHRPDRTHDDLHGIATRLLAMDPQARADLLADLSSKMPSPSREADVPR